MKKTISFLALAAVTAMAATAQQAVVKEAERAYKGGKEAAEVVKIITPAFSDPTTAQAAQTYFIPGAASYKEYDHLLGLKQFNKLPENGDKKMDQLLIQGFDYFTKAFPLDSIPDAKGKVKPKYSKEMVNTIVGHFADYTNAGADLWNAKDYEGAYRCWDIFCSIREIPAAVKALKANNAMQPDTVFGEIAFNQDLAACQCNKLPEALAAFGNAKKLGYNKKGLYDYAIAVATQLKNDDVVLAYAEEAIPLYGKEDPMYISQVANYYLQNKQLDKAFSVINDAIALDPNNSQYYVVQGVLYENSESTPDAKAKAKESYKKAMEIDPKNAQAIYYYGRQLCEEAFALGDTAPTKQDEYTAYFNEKIKPLFLQAADILEEAYNLNPDNTDVLKYLENVYYNLNDDAKLNDVKKRMTY